MHHPPFPAFHLIPQPYSQNSPPCDVGYCPVDLFYPFSIHIKRRSHSALLQALEVLDYEQGKRLGLVELGSTVSTGREQLIEKWRVNNSNGRFVVHGESDSVEMYWEHYLIVIPPIKEG
jgi:hypothetical protein